MEEQTAKSPKQGFPIENVDAKYVSGLSTILVATIQEAKDRISQIEYIFCSQLFPSFQSKSKTLQTIYIEARRSAEDEWKEKENDLLLQIEKLQREKQQAIEENQALKLEKPKPSKEQEEKIELLQFKLLSERLKVEELEHEIKHKSSEIEERIQWHNKLLETIQAKVSVIANKERQLKENEEKTNGLCAKLSGLEKKVVELQEEVKGKIEEVAKGQELAENLFRKIELQALEISKNEQMVTELQKEKQLLVVNLEDLEKNFCKLPMESKRKSEEVDEGRKVQQELHKKIELEMLKYKKQLEEKKQLVAKINGLEEKVNELLDEKKKRIFISDKYKKLKSEHNYLCRKLESILPQNKAENETGSLARDRNLTTSSDSKDQIHGISAAVSDTNKGKKETNKYNRVEDEIRANSVHASTSHSPNLNHIFPDAPKSGTKRAASSWRDTRSHQALAGPDPHDDFLDTPLENIKENLSKAKKDRAHDIPDNAREMSLDSSDDETQEMNVDHRPQKQQTVNSVTAKKEYKFVEPVRKKADRENLKGIECKQCTKFYDAVLPSDGNGDTSKRNLRCEHHDGVSRHRYRYAPPLTPEGFWNIGFESEM